MLRELASFFADLKDVVSEPVRATIVRRFCRVMADKLQAQNKEALRYWLSRDQGRFIRECEIRDTSPQVPEIEVSQVERWADKWLQVEKFRLKDDVEAPWRPITPEQNALRVTMINDLKNLVRDDSEDK